MGRDVVEALGLSGFDGQSPAQVALEWGVRRMDQQLELKTRVGHAKPVTATSSPPTTTTAGCSWRSRRASELDSIQACSSASASNAASSTRSSARVVRSSRPPKRPIASRRSTAVSLSSARARFSIAAWRRRERARSARAARPAALPREGVRVDSELDRAHASGYACAGNAFVATSTRLAGQRSSPRRPRKAASGRCRRGGRARSAGAGSGSSPAAGRAASGRARSSPGPPAGEAEPLREPANVRVDDDPSAAPRSATTTFAVFARPP